MIKEEIAQAVQAAVSRAQQAGDQPDIALP